MYSVYISFCRCCVFVSIIHTVAILSTVFCVICSLLMLVPDFYFVFVENDLENTCMFFIIFF